MRAGHPPVPAVPTTVRAIRVSPASAVGRSRNDVVRAEFEHQFRLSEFRAILRAHLAAEAPSLREMAGTLGFSPFRLRRFLAGVEPTGAELRALEGWCQGRSIPFVALEEVAVNVLSAWAHDRDRLGVRRAIGAAVLSIFEERGIKLPPSLIGALRAD
jgi:hypothetical protein